MKALILNTGSELKKLLMKKKYLVLTVLGAIICILRIGGNVLVSKITGGEVVIKSNLIMEMVGFVFDILVPLIIFMAVTDLFASEVQEDSMKASLLRPLTRFKVMTSKSLAVFVLGCMVTLAMFVISLIVQIVSGNSLTASKAGLILSPPNGSKPVIKIFFITFTPYDNTIIIII